jgi:hypothetical protein
MRDKMIVNRVLNKTEDRMEILKNSGYFLLG